VTTLSEQEMPQLSDTEENLILLCRLIEMINGSEVLRHECDAIPPDVNHAFCKEIMDRRKTAPIIATISERGYGNNLTLVKDILKRLASYDKDTDGQNWSNSITNASYILKDYISVVRYTHTRIMEIVMKIVGLHGYQEDLEAVEYLLSYQMERPSTAKRPYHLHVSTNGAGGGDLSHVVQRLEMELHTNMLCIFPAKSWMVNLYQGYEMSKISFSNSFIQREKIFQNSSAICVDAFVIAKMLESSAEEMEDVHHELVGWRMLPCAMALHKRLGGSSLLRVVGMDVLKCILEFI
jgi:hypothetical protein